ncbi:MAG: sulfatase-like hydrolase/transferase [Pseudomonadota bacterium]
MSRNAVTPFRGAGALAESFPAGWDTLEHFERYLDGEAPDFDDFYGFDHVELAIDHGARATGHHFLWALKQGAARDDLLVEYAADAPGESRSDEWWQIYRPPYDARFHSTQFVAERTIDFIETAAQGDAPWLAWCSFPDPHHPMTPPGEYFDRHDPANMPLPPTRHDALADAPDHLKVFRGVHPREQRNWVAPCGYGNDNLLREAIAATYGMIEMIDDGVGRVLATLDRLGVRDDTIVVFTSDHGDMMGDHGLFLKGFMHYRGTLQVPLVVDAPGRDAGRTDALASTVDLATTVLDLCGQPQFDGMQGVSLAPTLASPAIRVRDDVLIEDDIATVVSRLTPIPAKTRTLVTERFRYTRNSKGEEQLFDLRDDPDEMNDLKAVDASVRSMLLERMTDALLAADDAARGAPVTH